MNSKHTSLLVTAALLLAGFIFFWEKFMAGPAQMPVAVIPGLEIASVQRVQVRVSGQPEVLAERTNGGWHLIKPLPCPAYPEKIVALLAGLAELKPQSYLSPRELMSRPNAEAEFGFETPQASIMLFGQNGRRQILIGSRTAPGDQVFVELVGTPGIHLVSTNLLALVPGSAGDWRDTALLEWKSFQFDRLQVNNGPRVMELVHDPTNQLWRLVRLQARADGQRVEELLAQLREAQIHEFITDDPAAERAEYGLAAPDLELIFSQGSNTQAVLQFGASATNGTNVIYGNRAGTDTIFSLPAEYLAPWRAPATDFRDRHLFSFRTVPDSIEVKGKDQFTLKRQANNLWRVEPGNFIADTNYVNELIVALAQMQVTDFVKDVVTQPDLPGYGLDPAVREYTLQFSAPQAAKIQVLFGTNADETVYVKRTDEPSVSAVRRVDYQFLPAASWELRNRRIWQISETNVARLRIEENGRTRELIRNGTNAWSLAEGSAGMINPFGVEETVHRLGDLSAAAWVMHGNIDRAQFGFKDPPHKITLQLKDGTKQTVELGGNAPSEYPYALVTQNGEPWVFEFPWATAQYLQTYLSIPAREF